VKISIEQERKAKPKRNTRKIVEAATATTKNGEEEDEKTFAALTHTNTLPTLSLLRPFPRFHSLSLSHPPPQPQMLSLT